ncbi:MAG: NfeD family protein [Bacteroidales bacterium]|nr:NfeD family protein [Bacteroidales bacterium]MBN2699010.1 NfeD family protein [Bacteroidales bacterium]
MDLLSNPAVVWFLIGLGLLILELILPGLLVLFFGIGAWITALACALFRIDLNVQIAVFLVSSLLGLVLLRKFLKKRFFDRKNTEIEDQLEEFKGRRAKVVSDFVNGSGQVEFKGTMWKAESGAPLKKGDSVIITGKDSITLIVNPNKSQEK